MDSPTSDNDLSFDKNLSSENVVSIEQILSKDFRILKTLYSCDENNVIIYLAEDKLTKIKYVIKKYYCKSNNNNDIEDILN